MKKRVAWRMLAGICLFLISRNGVVLGQVQEAVQDKDIDRVSAVGKSLDELSRRADIKIKKKRRKISARASVSVGYESNPHLESERKGDLFEQVQATVRYVQPLGKTRMLEIDYDINNMAYNEFTDLSNLYNNLRLGFHQKLPFGVAGVYSDLGYFYYARSRESNFFFPRGSVYVQHNMTKTFSQQLLIESGAKLYSDEYALAGQSWSYQDNLRRDDRLSSQYAVNTRIGKSFYLSGRYRYTSNDSNMLYQDYYDYQSHRYSLSASWAMALDFWFLSGVSYTRKDYKTRVVSAIDEKDKEDLYSLNVGLRRALSQKDWISIMYVYRLNHSNDPSSEYIDNMWMTGWQHQF